MEKKKKQNRETPESMNGETWKPSQKSKYTR